MSRIQSHRPSSQRRDCGGVDHGLHRRLFLQGAAAGGLAGLPGFGDLFMQPVLADDITSRKKHCILLWLCGAPSQFETWDPKPGRATSGPFGAIDTALPGVQLSELMPRCATIMDRLAVIRSMKTEPSEHFQAIDLLTRGEKPRPPFTRPLLGTSLTELLGQRDVAIPQFVFLDPCPEGNEFKAFKRKDWAGWLDAQFGPVRAGGPYKIPDIERLADVTAADHQDREELRSVLSRRYAGQTKSSQAAAYNSAFQRVQGLMSCAPLFDLDRLPERDRERYGPGNFAQHTLLARHLIENGSTFVMVANGMPWDCHVLNHEIHQMLVPELDQVVHALITDLEDRGLLDDTLVVVMGEFGRTPWLNDARGRDHYPNAWSLALAGCGIRGGTVFGATDADGVEVTEQPIDQRRLFATIYRALGLDPHRAYELPGLPTFHRVEGAVSPVSEVLTNV